MNVAAVGLSGLCMLLLTGCGTHANPCYGPARPHHTPDGFRNLDPDARIGEGYWRWQWARRAAGLPPPAVSHRDWQVAPDLALLHTPAGNPSDHLDRPCHRAAAAGRHQRADRPAFFRTRAACLTATARCGAAGDSRARPAAELKSAPIMADKNR